MAAAVENGNLGLTAIINGIGSETKRIAKTISKVFESKTKYIFKAENLPFKWNTYISPALKKLNISGEFFQAVNSDLERVLNYFVPIELFDATNKLTNSFISWYTGELVRDVNGDKTTEVKTTKRELYLKVSDAIMSLTDNLKLPFVVSSLNLEAAMPIFSRFSYLNLVGFVGGASLTFSFVERSIQTFDKIQKAKTAPENLNELNQELVQLKTELRNNKQNEQEFKDIEKRQKLLEAKITKQESFIAERKENLTQLVGQVSLVALGIILMIGNLTGIFSPFSIVLTASIPVVTTFVSQYFKEGRAPTTA